MPGKKYTSIANWRLKSWNRRMRKKMHVAEFQEMGFEFTATLTHGLQQDEFFNFTHQFIQFIEANNLVWGGGGDAKKIGGFICAFNRGTVTLQQQRTVGDWLRLQNEVAEVELQPLKDCWYGGENISNQ